MDFGQNIEALVRGESLSTYQKALANKEYECWKNEYLRIQEELSKLRQDAVSNRRELLIAYELKLWINPTKEQIEIAEKIVDMYLSN